jgi:homoserine kinase
MTIGNNINSENEADPPMDMDNVKVFAPATIANVGSAFDILGFALRTIGDEMIFRKTEKKGIKIVSKGLGKLPEDPEKNIAGVVATEMMKLERGNFGVEIEINKQIFPGSGLGSSASSAAGTAVGLNSLLNRNYTDMQLIKFAMVGEMLASGAEHADNVAPAIMGKFTLISGYNPLNIIEIAVPDDLFCTIIHPQIEIKTIEARKVLPQTIPLKTAVLQWGNVAGLVAGLYRSDYLLIGKSMGDYIVEPARASLIPQFYQLKDAALNAGALGCSIAGSGPAVFAFSKGKEIAERVREAFDREFSQTGIAYNLFVSEIGTEGARLIS